MLKLIERAISAHNMLDGVTEITVALSGGADSVALLHSMLALSDKYGIKVYAAHLNHSLRGEESDRDMQFVIELCKRLEVPLFCEKADVTRFASQEKQSLELAARNVRYDFLQKVSRGRIATAHTADDNAETVLYNLSRGTGITGLCGIPPVRDTIIRPLILCKRSQIEQYCMQNELSYVTDSTNSDCKYARNRIRHEVLPQLRLINDGCVNNISRMCDGLREDAQYLSAEATKLYKLIVTPKGIPVKELKKLHKAIAIRVLLLYCKEKTGLTPDSYHFGAMLNLLNTESRTQLSGPVFAVNSGGYFHFDRISRAKQLYEDIGNDFNNLRFPGIKFEFSEGNSKKINNLVFKNSFDCDKISGKLVIRHRFNGDAFSPIGRNCTKTLKKLFNEAHTSLSKRNNILIAADDIGIVWVEGFGIDERVKISDSTQQFVTINKG